MKTSILNPSSFLPEEALSWAQEKGCEVIENSKDLGGKEFDVCFLSYQDSVLLTDIPGTSAEVRSLGIFDGLKKIDGGLWPQIYIKADLQAVLAKKQWSLPRQQPCFLWGSTWTLRWMLSSALQFGFKEVVVFHPEPEWAAAFARPGIDIHWMTDEKITDMSFVGSFFMTHFERSIEPRQFKEAIRYMHFLTEQSYFIDLSYETLTETEFLAPENRLVGSDAWKEILSHRMGLFSP